MLRILRLAFGVGLLVLLLRRVELAQLVALARRGDPKQLAFALGLLFLANPLIQSVRLHVLVAHYTKSFFVSFQLFAVGAFFNTMLPSNVGGDAVKLLYLKRLRGESWGAPFALLMLHRATGMLVLLVSATLRALFDHERIATLLARAHIRAHVPLDALAFACVGALALGAGWLILSPRYRARITERARRFLRECRDGLRAVGARAAAALLLATIAFHAARLYAFDLLISYAGERIEPLDLLIVLAVTALAGMIPISVGALGLMEGAISVMLQLFGVSAGAGLIVALSNRAILLLGAAFGGLVYLTVRPPAAERST